MQTRNAMIDGTTSRRGSMAPAVVAALAVSMGAIALALDRAWIDTAQVEMSRTTEAAALAAARELATDDLLRPASQVASRVAAARVAAQQVAALNTVAGHPLPLLDGDVQFGKYVYSQSTDSNLFLETEVDPQSVVVAGRLERSRANPIALVMRGFAGPRTADLARLSVATLDNRLIGVRAGRNLPVPALPLAILDGAPSAGRTDTWQVQIVARKGTDVWRYNAASDSVSAAPDGIPEMLLSSSLPGTANPNKPAGGTAPGNTANVCLVDFSGRYDAAHVAQMIAHGWTQSDLTPLNSEISLAAPPAAVAASFTIGDREYAALHSLVGQSRICLLFSLTPPAGSTATNPAVSITGLVAGRIMSLSRIPGQAPRIVFQPAVIITRAARTIVETLGPAASAQSTVARNPYIFKMTLSQ